MGIKLNDEIAGLICRAFTGLSNLWEQGAMERIYSQLGSAAATYSRRHGTACLVPVLAHLPIRLIGWTGAFGASTMFALTADLLAFLTLPYFVCYVAATVTFRQSFSFLRALFDVFRGELPTSTPRGCLVLTVSTSAQVGSITRYDTGRSQRRTRWTRCYSARFSSSCSARSFRRSRRSISPLLRCVAAYVRV